MQMAPNAHEVTTAAVVINNGTPTRSAHIQELDAWAAWLAMCGHTNRPAIVVGGDLDGSVYGWRSETTAWSDYALIPVIVPAFASYLQIGITVTGIGEIRIRGTKQTNAILVEVSTLIGVSAAYEHAPAQARTYWIDPPGPTAADTNHALATHTNSASGDGYKVNTLQDLEFAFRTTDTDYDLTVHAVTWRTWPAPDGADLTGYDTSDGGLAP